jgi:hypothetical protein
MRIGYLDTKVQRRGSAIWLYYLLKQLSGPRCFVSLLTNDQYEVNLEIPNKYGEKLDLEIAAAIGLSLPLVNSKLCDFLLSGVVIGWYVTKPQACAFNRIYILRSRYFFGFCHIHQLASGNGSMCTSPFRP